MGNWRGYLIAFGLGILAGAFLTWRVMSWKEAAQETKQAKATVKYVLAAAEITYNTSFKFEGIKADDKKHTDDIVGIVPVTITPAVDIAYPVPCGFVRLYDAAARSPIPDTSCKPDGSPSGVAISDVAETTIRNFGQYDQVAHQLEALQDWVREQKALSDEHP